MFKKIGFILGSVLCVGTATALILTTNNVKGDNNVTTQMFNELKAEVEVIKTDVEQLRKQNESLANENTELKTEISNLTKSVSANEIEILNTKSNLNKTKDELNVKINSNTTKISNITQWQDELYNLKFKWYKHGLEMHIWSQLEEFRKSQ